MKSVSISTQPTSHEMSFHPHYGFDKMDLNRFKNVFFDRFGHGNAALYFSPGRINLIGEHVDYNGGTVLPCALSLGTYLIIRKNNKDHVNFHSLNLKYKARTPLASLGNKAEKDAWVNYPLGVMAEFKFRGINFKGMDFLFMGDIPIGSGLSSSASIELVTAIAVNELYQAGLDMIEMVKLAQNAENNFVNVKCGIMDQFAAGMGKKDHGIAIECDTLCHEYVPLKMDGYKIIIADTKKPRELVESKYNERRAECEKALSVLKTAHKINYLCELDSRKFNEVHNQIEDSILRRRARHVIEENDRVKKAVKVLKEGDIRAFGEIMNASHDSLRDLYEVTGFELDTLVDEARKVNGVAGARMTGAGFGGCAVILAKENSIDDLCVQVKNMYMKKTGIEPEFYMADISDGTRKLEEITNEHI